LHPRIRVDLFLGEPLVPGCIDKLSEGEESKVGAIDVVARDLAEKIVRGKRDLAPEMRKTSMRGSKLDFRGSVPQHTEHTDVDAILEVLIAEVIGHNPVLLHGANAVVLTLSRSQPTVREEGRDSPEHGFLFMSELHEKKLPVHRDALELAPVGQNDVRVEFKPTLLNPRKMPMIFPFGKS
jgi:hypothetical protein